jgi:hypothetical protein
MNPLDFIKSPAIYVEFGQNSLKMLDGEDGLELSIDRLENGRLNPICADRLVQSLRVFLKKYSWRPGVRAFCAIGARGVSLRRLTLPASSREETERLLPLQIEREFPLLPEELAWGYCPLSPERVSGNGAPAVQELLVVAVKREVVEDYAEVLSGCGLEPVFTLGAWVRSSLCIHPPKSYALLEIGRNHSELISFENAVPTALRILPWGSEEITRALESKQDLAGLARTIQPQWVGQKVYVGGEKAENAKRLAQAIGSTVECQAIEVTPGEGRSAAIVGLKKSCETNGNSLPLILKAKKGGEAQAGTRPSQWKWAIAAGFLVIVSIGLRYAEPFFQQPRLAKRIAVMKAYRDSLPNIDKELSFLQYLKTNQPPYLEPIYTIANGAPAGARIETLTMNRRGDLSLRASMRDSQQVVDLRSKLIGSGLFSSVVVEEQTPSPDRKKIVVRMTAQWKTVSERKYPELPPSTRPLNRTPAFFPGEESGDAPPTTALPVESGAQGITVDGSQGSARPGVRSAQGTTRRTSSAQGTARPTPRPDSDAQGSARPGESREAPPPPGAVEEDGK